MSELKQLLLERKIVLETELFTIKNLLKFYFNGKESRYKPRICQKCGKEYIPGGAMQKYCSEKCGLKHKPEKEKQRLQKIKEQKKPIIETNINESESKQITQEQIEKSKSKAYKDYR